MADMSLHRTKPVHCLLYGEIMAEQAATALACAMPHAGLRRAYRKQASDEARHARMFRDYLHHSGAEPVDVPHLPELHAYRDHLFAAAEKGRLLTLVTGVNVVLEALACVGFQVSGQWVEATGEDPAWVALMHEIEADERRHVRLAAPALRVLGGGQIPKEAPEVLGELREVAVTTLSAVGQDLARWGIDPVAIFDAAIESVHPKLYGALVDPHAAAR